MVPTIPASAVVSVFFGVGWKRVPMEENRQRLDVMSSNRSIIYTDTCSHNKQSKGEKYLYIQLLLTPFLQHENWFLEKNIILTSIVSWPIIAFPAGQFLQPKIQFVI